MKPTWRWFGPEDKISLSEICQTGAQGIVTALHHIATGDVWSVEEIQKRNNAIKAQDGLSWDVAESVPVSEAIKRQSSEMKEHIEAYKITLQNLASCGVTTVCYNFMPVLDWTRTDLASKRRNGATAMKFDLVEFAAFDLFLLNRASAKNDYSDEVQAMASDFRASLDVTACEQLTNNIVAGLPGSQETWTVEDIRDQIDAYKGVDAAKLRAHLVDFLGEVVPVAESMGVKLCCHPDDPPFPILGLPRVVSSVGDYQAIVDAIDSPSNGVTFCTGSLGVSSDFDPVDFVERLGDKIVFSHLRNVKRETPSDGRRISFFESEHLDGDVDIPAAIRALLAEEDRRKKAGREDWSIPFRPDHGQDILSDLGSGLAPGYPLVGRMKGLSELRGVIAANESQNQFAPS